MKNFRKLFLVLLTLSMIFFSVHSYANLDQKIAQLNEILDVSGDNYFQKAVEMISQANSSVIMSMFLINPNSKSLMTLLEELDKAIARGVDVELYVNARYNADDWAFLNNYFYASPRKSITIYPIGENHFLYHKLIITDEKRLLEGSLNWSRNYSKDDLEYALYLEDSLLAQRKILFLHKVNHAKKEMENPDLLWRSKMSWIKKSVVYAQVPVRTITERDMLWALIDKKEYVLFDLYLMLLYQSALEKSLKFDVNYQELAYGMAKDIYKLKKQRKIVYKSLCRLEKLKLIKITAKDKQRIEVEIPALSAPTFDVPIDIVHPDFIRNSGHEFKSAYLLCALLNDIYNRTKDLFTDQQREHIKALLEQYQLAPIPPLLQ